MTFGPLDDASLWAWISIAVALLMLVILAFVLLR
jgi:hypothetical protein